MYVVLSIASLVVSLIVLYLYFRLRNEVRNSNQQDKIGKINYEYKEIVDNLPYLYFRSSLAGEIKILSNSVNGLLGYDKEEMVGELSQNFQTSGNREKFLQALKDGNGQVQEYESQMVAKDGALKWISVNARFIYDDDEVTGIDGSARDISDKKEVEKKLAYAKEQLIGLVK